MLGLVSNPNAIPVTTGGKTGEKLTLAEVTTKREHKKSAAEPLKKNTFARKFDDHDSQRALTGYRLTADRRPPFWMSDEDVRYIRPLVERYGREYSKMFKDLTLNPLQKTKAWLKKKAVRFDNFTKSQQVV